MPIEVELRERRARSDKLQQLIRDTPIAPGSPWQNGVAERLIGSIRRECTDHVIDFGEGHLRRILQFYARYYNVSRNYRSLNKDAPVHRPIESHGVIISGKGKAGEAIFML
jgi:transposase InsO family protein